MALRAGERVPAFEIPGSDGGTWSDVKLRGRTYVLTFYPKDETPGCVAQACAIRDAWALFVEAGVLVFGVSRDSVEEHRAFASHRKLPHVLLSDASGAVHKAFDVGRTFGVTNRVSYLVGPEGTIREAFKSNLRPEVHAARMLEAAKRIRE